MNLRRLGAVVCVGLLWLICAAELDAAPATIVFGTGFEKSQGYELNQPLSGQDETVLLVTASSPTFSIYLISKRTSDSLSKQIGRTKRDSSFNTTRTKRARGLLALD